MFFETCRVSLQAYRTGLLAGVKQGRDPIRSILPVVVFSPIPSKAKILPQPASNNNHILIVRQRELPYALSELRRKCCKFWEMDLKRFNFRSSSLAKHGLMIR